MAERSCTRKIAIPTQTPFAQVSPQEQLTPDVLEAKSLPANTFQLRTALTTSQAQTKLLAPVHCRVSMV